MQNETIAAVVKVSPPVTVSILQWMTGAIPTLMLWVTFIYAVLQTYVLIRDKFFHRGDK